MLSAFVSLFLSPLNWIILLIAAAWFLRKQRTKKLFVVSAITVFIVFGNSWLLNAFARYWQPAPVEVSSLPVYEVGIVAAQLFVKRTQSAEDSETEVTKPS